MSKKYLKFLSKTFSSVLVVYAVVCAFTYIVFPIMMIAPEHMKSVDYVSTFAGSVVPFFIVGAIPLILHNRYYTKNSSDIYLSLPISRRQAFITENGFALIGVLAITTVMYLIGGFTTMAFASAASKELLSPISDILEVLPLLLITTAVVYLISMVAVSFSNSQAEARSMVFYLHIIPVLLYYIVLIVTKAKLKSWTNLMFYAPGSYVSAIASYNHYYGLEDITKYFFNDYGFNLLVLAINLVFWLAVGYVALLQFEKLKSEHLGTTQMETLGAKNFFVVAAFLGYVYLGLLLGATLDSGLLDEILLPIYFIVFLGSVIVYWITTFGMRKKIRFLKEDLIRFAIAVIPSQIIGLIIYFAFLA